MTTAGAMSEFFNSFGIKAYTVDYVPDDVAFPWVTYENKSSDFGNSTTIQMTAWFHTESEKVPNDFAEKVRNHIKNGGRFIPCDGGALWFRIGQPWCSSITAQEDKTTKGRVMNIEVEFLRN